MTPLGVPRDESKIFARVETQLAEFSKAIRIADEFAFHGLFHTDMPP